MKHYSEDVMKGLRLAIEEVLLEWEAVSTKKMFGSPCFLAGGKMFCLLVTKGIVITKLDPHDRDELSGKYQSAPLVAGNKIIQTWVRLPMEKSGDLHELLPFIRKSYEAALRQ
ncbi:MAG: TfoX/Sxy family protein [ANME-2 cluster archaeon]|nr:TfoX/Sxy family protein [ANME-2 cluster archaeon]